MILCIDIGNTQTKAALYERGQERAYSGDLQRDELQGYLASGVTSCWVSKTGSNPEIESLLKEASLYRLLNADVILPISLNYKTPETLGPDRIATAIAAHANYPDQAVVILDAGTCLTLDLLTADGVFQGGLISPGLQMRFKAMHEYTEKLPKVELDMNITFPGRSTEESMQVGVYQSFVYEVKGYLDAISKEYGELVVVDCSTQDFNFDKVLNYKIFAHPKFVLEGLMELATQNA